jgi:hypothetical protein
LEQKVYDYVLRLDAPDYIKVDIKSTINNTEKHLELSIIEASKTYAAYRECLVNRKVFEEMYDVPFKEIIKMLDIKRKELKSFDLLLENQNFEKYLSNIRKLSHSLRWNQQKRIFPISVMSHLVIITFISYII